MVEALNRNAIRYTPGVTFTEIVSVNSPVVVTRASTLTEATTVPDGSIRATMFWVDVGDTPTVLIPHSSLVRAAARDTYRALRYKVPAVPALPLAVWAGS